MFFVIVRICQMINMMTIAAFMSELLAGCYSGKSLSNNFYRVRTWHILHSVAWSINDKMDTLLRVVCNLIPASVKHVQ